MVLIGGPEDRPVLEEINALTGGKTINTAGELSLGQVATLIETLSVFLGNDSSLIHIAVALKVPVIQLFGPDDPEPFGYTGGNNILLMKTDCPHNPCTQRDSKHKDNWCMDRISVDDVIKHFLLLLINGMLSLLLVNLGSNIADCLEDAGVDN